MFRLGRVLEPPRSPGRVWMIPGVDRLVVVDMQSTTIDIPPQEVMTKETLPLTVSARLHARVMGHGRVDVRAAEHSRLVRRNDGVCERAPQLELLLVPAEVDEICRDRRDERRLR